MSTQPSVPAQQQEQSPAPSRKQKQQHKEQLRQERIDELAQKMLPVLRNEERKKPPHERRSEDALWKAVRSQATKDERNRRFRQQAKDSARQVGRTSYAEAKSTLYRNRKQLAPWYLACPYAALGVGGWAAAEFGSGYPVAISALFGATAMGASIVAWRRWIGQRAPKALAERIKATLGLLTVWTTLMPLIPTGGQGGMWIALLAGMAYMALPWWRAHEHPLPGPDMPERPISPAPQQPAEPDQRTRRINGIVHAWNTKVAHPEKGAVPRSSLTHVHSTDAVDRYRITLDDEGSVTRKQLRTLHEKLALALGVLEGDITFEDTDHPATLIMRHLVGEPVTTYDGPVVLCNGVAIHSRWEITPGSTVDIVYGYYTDGDGVATYRILDEGSVNSMFVLGGTGSGKTRLLEILGIALRFLGCRIWYVDGQEGASSALLNEHADWAVPFTPEGAESLVTALGEVCTQRNAELRNRPELENEYSYDPHRPPVIVLMEEAHALFCLKRGKNSTVGKALGEYAVQIRKLGVGFVPASQDFDLTETFGNSAKLRQSLQATNNFAAMRLVDKSRIGMLPSSCPKLDSLPPKGYGFSPFSDRPGALWRTPNLDGGAHRKGDWMAAYTPAPAITTSPATTVDDAAEPDDDEEDADSSARPAPAAGVVHFPGAARQEEQSAPSVGASATPQPTAAEQRVLDLLTEEPQHTPATAGKALDISVQSARKHLRSLATKGLARKDVDGAYSAIEVVAT